MNDGQLTILRTTLVDLLLDLIEARGPTSEPVKRTLVVLDDFDALEKALSNSNGAAQKKPERIAI